MDWLLDVFATWLYGLKVIAITLAVIMFISGLDDFFIDVVYWVRRIKRKLSVYRRYPRMSYRELYKPDEKPLAIMVPAWNETGVIGNMAELAATTLDYENYHIFVGTYPNDPDTQRDVDEVCARFPNVHKVVCARPGPTSKADCLNNVLDAITQFERSANFAFAGFILHDAEDVISPMELRLFNYLVERKDLIQIPVYPFEREWTHFTSMTYIDEFSELHGKDVPVREALAGQVPSAGVGTCFSRRAVTALLADGDGIAFDVQSLTEDYDIGFRLKEKGMTEIFVRFPVVDEAKEREQRKFLQHARTSNMICVREYFPDTFSTAVRQKSRWIIGIVFQGFKTHKWTSSLTLNYFLWRDRKGAISNFVSFLAMLVMLQLLLLLAYESLWPNAWHFLSIFSGSAWLMTLLWLNFGLMVNRIVQRVIFVTGYYGLTQGLLSVLRLFWGNLINFMANWRALKQVLQHGDPRRVAWDKTTHDFPSVTGDTRSLRPLGQILLENQVITEEQLDTALRNRVEGLRLGGSMLMQGLISAEQLAQALAEQNGVAWESIDAWQIPSSLIAEMPASVALHYAVLPLRLENDELIVGSEDGIDPVSLAAIPVEVKSVTTVEELLAQQKACDAAPTLRCRSEVGQNALRLAQLPVARAQLNDATFAASPEGKTLRTDLLQRAIYLKQWSQADTLYNEARQQNTLSAAERRQWFDVLLAGQLDDRILALQSQGIFTDPQSYITYATALAYRGEKARLQHYLNENKPLFTTDAQEKSWLYLLSKYSANPVQALANYTVQFADNRQYVVGATLPVLLKEGQYDAAQKLLATLPANEMLEERYAVSVATRNKAESLRLARLLYQQEPANLTRLDQLTWQLMQNEQSREAADLLLQRYPFQGDARVSQTLMARLASLLESHPYLATPAKVAILSKPLPLAEQRQWQSQLPGIADNCPAIVRLLGDMSPSYDAAAWNRLAKCYRDTLPGVALYAWLQAEQRQPNAWQHRAVAYQAYQVEDYATALAAWQKISLHDMSNEDLLAAANTAQAAGNGAARDRWLQQAEQRGLGNNALYWWLHAQRYIPGQPELALSDLTRSINIAPSANAYVARATIYRQRHNVPAAVSDLRAALELEPNNSNIQAALGYALWDSGDIAQSREMLEQAHKGLPDDPALIRQLAYVNQRLDDMPATQHYARLVIDDIDNQALITPLTPEQNQQRFNFRRLHEEVGRRWTFSFDSSIGLRSGAMSTANNNVGGAAPGKSYRSYGQLEAEYRIGRNMLLEGDLLSVYSRVFADTGENGVMMPVKNPMSGTGLRWKPLRDQIFFLAVEQQLPLNGQNGASDTMLRASASFFNGGKYSDEWHPNGSGWFAQNLYLDAAQYIRQDIQAWTADYRVSWHQKVANGQTIEPYAHVQDNGYRDKGTQGAQLGGVGVRWNIWTGETHYDAWPHKVSLGVEYQHTFKAINQRNGERNNAFLTIGVHW
ncbi:TPA: phage receptor [Escherichia coli]|nr:phage receptor [Escherichia coli]